MAHRIIRNVYEVFNGIIVTHYGRRVIVTVDLKRGFIVDHAKRVKVKRLFNWHASNRTIWVVEE